MKNFLLEAESSLRRPTLASIGCPGEDQGEDQGEETQCAQRGVYHNEWLQQLREDRASARCLPERHEATATKGLAGAGAGASVAHTPQFGACKVGR